MSTQKPVTSSFFIFALCVSTLSSSDTATAATPTETQTKLSRMRDRARDTRRWIADRAIEMRLRAMKPRDRVAWMIDRVEIPNLIKLATHNEINHIDTLSDEQIAALNSLIELRNNPNLILPDGVQWKNLKVSVSRKTSGSPNTQSYNYQSHELFPIAPVTTPKGTEGFHQEIGQQNFTRGDITRTIMTYRLKTRSWNDRIGGYSKDRTVVELDLKAVADQFPGNPGPDVKQRFKSLAITQDRTEQDEKEGWRWINLGTIQYQVNNGNLIENNLVISSDRP